MRLFKRNRKNHWEHVYQKLSPTEVGWYQAHPAKSLQLINNACENTDSRIIDFGGGTSKLSEYLLDQGYRKLTVLDIACKSINKAKSQFGEKSKSVTWIAADITKYSFKKQYDVWHDRAAFHFLTKTEDRKSYIAALNLALNQHGQLIMATLSLDAPPKCSGLPVVRYSSETLQDTLGDNFNLAETIIDNHVSPSGVLQNFIFCRFVKDA